MRTIKECAQEALDCQNACNLSGVVHTFSSVLSDLRNRLQDSGQPYGTEASNKHAITLVFLDKLASLSDYNYDGANKAFEVCRGLAMFRAGKDEKELPAL